MSFPLRLARPLGVLLVLLGGATAALAQPVAKATPGAPAPAASRAAASFAEGDEHWDDRFGYPSLGYSGYTAQAAPNGDVYVGGYFSSAGGLPANNIARWDGRRYHALGAGVDGYVYDVEVAPNGDVYVAGDFANAGTVRANGVAKWSPATGTWSALGGGFTNEYGSDETVRALAFVGGVLYAGGEFTRSGGRAVAKIARWDGAAWQELGGGLGMFYTSGTYEANDYGTVYALLAVGTDLYVGGALSGAGGVRVDGVARWNTATSTWHALGGGLDMGYTYESAGTAYALAHDGTALYVGGRFGKAGPFATGVPANNVARWNGTAWNALGDGIQGQFGANVNALAVGPGGLYATGNFDRAGGQTATRFARWNGTAWDAPGGGLDGEGKGLTRTPSGDLFVAGEFAKGGDVFSRGAVRWTGTAFAALGEGLTYSTISARIYAVVKAGGLVYAAGYPTNAGGRPAAGVAAWDGAAWRALGAGTGGTDGTVYTLAVGPDGAVYAGGAFTTAGGGSANRVAKWDPAAGRWSALGSGTNGAVRALAFGPDGALYAGGDFTAAGAVNARYVAKWTGTAWQAVGTGVDSYVYALAAGPGGRIYAGGAFDEAGGGVANGVAVWNGTNWSALAEGVTRRGSFSDFAGEVHGLAVVGADVYATGRFDKAGTSAAAGVAKWNQATGWAALADGLGGGDQRGHALATDGRLVYVGGNFATAGGQASSAVAAWDVAAGAWRGLGSGLARDAASAGTAYALGLDGADLYVGGDFYLAGGKPASGVALWHGEAPVANGGRLELDAADHAFGGVPVGTAAEWSFTVANAAGAAGPLTGTVALGAGPFTLTAGGGAFTLAPGASRTVTVRFAPAAVGAATATLTVTHDGTNAPATREVYLSGTGAGRDAVIVLRNFDPNGANTLPRAQGGGFVFGSNAYSDRAKATLLTPPAGKSATTTITGVRVFFGGKTALPGAQVYTVRLYAGTTASGPVGAPLYSQAYPVAGAVLPDGATPRPTDHPFTTPVAVSGPFFVAVDFGAYTDPELLGILTGPQLGAPVAEDWEQASDGTWATTSAAWGASGQRRLWIEADAATTTDAAAEAGPARFGLRVAGPNPFRAGTALAFTVAEAGPVRLDLYDAVGRHVATLADGVRAPGVHTARLDGAPLAAGVYVARLRAGGASAAVVLTRVP